VLANDLNLSSHNPAVMYSFLALYGLLTVMVLIYVHTKFRFAAKTLKLLSTEWQRAQSSHSDFVGAAQKELSKLAMPMPTPALPLRNAAVKFDVRNQVIAMAKRGVGPTEIARSCGLHEGEVEVILGMARLQK
jgi:hypothetical protein